LADKIRYRLGHDDILDLIFDMDWAENEVLAFDRDTDQLIQRIIDLADRRGQIQGLEIAVERILSPITANNLPRIEKLSVDTPRPALRYFLLENYSFEEVQVLSELLGINWEIINGNNKKEKIRALLLYLIRRNRLKELIETMKTSDTNSRV
jgi:hypothetical protein